jgi:hypothetical protein
MLILLPCQSYRDLLICRRPVRFRFFVAVALVVAVPLRDIPVAAPNAGGNRPARHQHFNRSTRPFQLGHGGNIIPYADICIGGSTSAGIGHSYGVFATRA